MSKTKASTGNTTASLSFEKTLSELEQLVKRMESGELSLEDSLTAFEQGIKLTRECQQSLLAAEQKVQMLLEQNGKLVVTDFHDNEPDATPKKKSTKIGNT